MLWGNRQGVTMPGTWPSQNRRRLRSARWCGAIPALAVLAACATAGPDGKPRVIWQSGLDYVRVEPQDSEAAPPNDHPVEFTPEQIGAMLASVEIVEPGQRRFYVFGEREERPPAPVFTATEIDKVDDPIAAALASAGPREDVTFATSDFHGVDPYGLIGDTLNTAGRVFYRDGELHLIFGEVHVAHAEEIKPRDHPRGGYVSKAARLTQPVPPGRRQGARQVAWRVAPEPGIDLAGGDGEARPDWLVLEPETVLARAEREREREREAAATQAPEASEDLERLDDTTAAIADQQRALLERLEQVETELRAARPAPADATPEPPAFSFGAAPQAPRSAPQPAPRPQPALLDGAASPELERRLARLRRLFDLGLITEAVYEERLHAILDDL